MSGLMDTFATSVSLALQYGVPLRDLVNKFAHVRFEPSGFTGNQEIPIAKSIVDYIFRWLGSRFLPADEQGADRPDRPRRGGRLPVAYLLRWRFRRGILPLAEPPRLPEEGPSAIDEAVDPPTDRPSADRRGRRAGAVGVRPGPEGRAPVVTNGARRTAMRTATARPTGTATARAERDRRLARDDEGRLHRPGGRPQLRRMRLDHGPQRQLLQVPQLRLHERLQLRVNRPAERRPGNCPAFFVGLIRCRIP